MPMWKPGIDVPPFLATNPEAMRFLRAILDTACAQHAPEARLHTTLPCSLSLLPAQASLAAALTVVWLY